MNHRVVIVTALLFICSTGFPQFRATNKQTLSVASAGDDKDAYNSLEALQNFFQLAQSGNRELWEQTLSKHCHSEKHQKCQVDKWYELLKRKDLEFTILNEFEPVKSRQYIYYYDITGAKKSTVKKSVTLVKEHGEWKILNFSI